MPCADIKKNSYHPDFYKAVASVLSQFTQRNGIVVEIGTRMGDWLRGLMEYHPVDRAFAIDPWPRRSKRGLFDTFPRWHENIKPWAFRSVFPIRGTSQEWGSVWPEELRPHVVYVDGCHKTPAVRDDGVIWWDLLHPGGAMFFHDANERGVKLGIDAFLGTLDSSVKIQLERAEWGPGSIVTEYLRKPCAH